jgi:hypothetical protein
VPASHPSGEPYGPDNPSKCSQKATLPILTLHGNARSVGSDSIPADMPQTPPTLVRPTNSLSKVKSATGCTRLRSAVAVWSSAFPVFAPASAE